MADFPIIKDSRKFEAVSLELPRYPIKRTSFENLDDSFLLISRVRQLERFRIQFNGLCDRDFKILLDHYDDQYNELLPFQVNERHYAKCVGSFKGETTTKPVWVTNLKNLGGLWRYDPENRPETPASPHRGYHNYTVTFVQA